MKEFDNNNYSQKMEATLECVTVSTEESVIACHTDCGPFWNDDILE